MIFFEMSPSIVVVFFFRIFIFDVAMLGSFVEVYSTRRMDADLRCLHGMEQNEIYCEYLHSG